MMNLERRFNLMERKIKASDGRPDRSGKKGKNPYNGKIVHGPSYMVDFVDEDVKKIRKFDFDVLLPNKGMPGMNITKSSKMKRGHRTNACRPKQYEDVVITWG